MKKNKCITIGLVIAMTVGMIGCSNGASGNDGEASSSGKDDRDIKTLTVLMYTDWYKAGWEALELSLIHI